MNFSICAHPFFADPFMQPQPSYNSKPFLNLIVIPSSQIIHPIIVNCFPPISYCEYPITTINLPKSCSPIQEQMRKTHNHDIHQIGKTHKTHSLKKKENRIKINKRNVYKQIVRNFIAYTKLNSNEVTR